jgi:hypothetical protein
MKANDLKMNINVDIRETDNKLSYLVKKLKEVEKAIKDVNNSKIVITVEKSDKLTLREKIIKMFGI